MEAHETRHTQNPSEKGAVDYFADEFYPTLKAEVNGFRDLIESLAINLLPLLDIAEVMLEGPSFAKPVRIYDEYGLTLKSKGTIGPPPDPAAVAVGIVQESIWMNIRIDQPGKVQLTASVLSDLTRRWIMPGEYSLRGGYQLSVRFPNAGLGGRPLIVEIEATLTPVP